MFSHGTTEACVLTSVPCPSPPSIALCLLPPSSVRQLHAELAVARRRSARFARTCRRLESTLRARDAHIAAAATSAAAAVVDADARHRRRRAERLGALQARVRALEERLARARVLCEGCVRECTEKEAALRWVRAQHERAAAELARERACRAPTEQTPPSIIQTGAATPAQAAAAPSPISFVPTVARSPPAFDLEAERAQMRLADCEGFLARGTSTGGDAAAEAARRERESLQARIDELTTALESQKQRHQGDGEGGCRCVVM